MRKLATLVLVIVAMLSGVTAATAGGIGGSWPPPSQPATWPTAPCYDGVLYAEKSSVSPVDKNGNVVLTTQGAMWCENVTDPKARWALGMWKPTQAGGEVSPGWIQPYNINEHTKFDPILQIPANSGVCLLQDNDTKISCVRLVETNGTITVVQTKPDDPFFFGRAEINALSSPVGCGPCW